jgi:hypothetical protein
MNQNPRIKPTLINDEDAIPKAIEEPTEKTEADRWAPRSIDLGVGSADLAQCQVGPPLADRLLARSFST